MVDSIILGIVGPPVAGWNAEDRVEVDDNDPAYYALYSSPAQTTFLYASIYADQFPTGATPVGVIVTKKLAHSLVTSLCRDVTVEFVHNEIIISENKANVASYESDTNYHYYAHGADDDLWEMSLTDEMINSGTLALRFKCEKYSGGLGVYFYVDYFEIEVFYEGGIISPVKNPYGPAIQVV